MEQISIEETKSIINKIFRQASSGKISIESEHAKNSPWLYYTKFYAKVGGCLLKNGEDIFAEKHQKAQISEKDSLVPIVQIPNAQTLALLTQRYLNIAQKVFIQDINKFDYTQESFKEMLFLGLLINTTNFDRNNFLSFIETRTKMLENQLKTGHFVITNHFPADNKTECTLKIILQKNSCFLEAPYRFTPSFSLGDDTHDLPTITFGIIGDTVHIFAIQAKNIIREKQQEQKKEALTTDKQPKKKTLKDILCRTLFRVNKGIDKEDQIGKISPYALSSLAIFLSVMKKEGIKHIVAPNFMPLRYQTNLSGEENYFEQNGKGFLEEPTFNQVVEKHNDQQRRITDNFALTLLRYCHHFDGCTFDYDSIKQQLEITLSNKSSSQENMIEDIDKVCKTPIGLKESVKEK